jgi:2-oxoglutarate dehydrogenase E2 component (dihydrolipoamide succinyltransferase)
MTVTMPQLGETVTEGTILSWAKKVGDTIAVDEVLVEISTDKVDTEMPSPTAGVIEKILVAEGETVEVGTEIVVIADGSEDAATEPAATGDAAAEAAAAEPAEPADAETTEETEPEPVPAQGPTGGGAVWSQQGPTGTERPPPEPMEPVEPAASTPAPAPVAPAAVAAAAPTAAASPSGDDSRRAALSPVVRKLASENDVDLDQVKGSGAGGRITRKDVESFIASGGAAAAAAEPAVPVVVEDAAATKVIVEEPEPVVAVKVEAPPAASEPAASEPAVDDDETVEELSKIRSITAERMVESKRTSAHVWTSVEVDFEAVAQARQRNGPKFKQTEGFSLTYMPFIARATIDALAAYPVVNSSIDVEDGTRTFHRGVDLGIAVDLSQEGLIVLTIPEADSASLTGLARDIRGIAVRARDGHLQPDDLSTSTFTVTNPGPFGSFMSAPIINQPNVAILSTDTVVKRPVVATLPDGTDTVAIRHIGYLGLSWDHRAFDGSTAVLFLARIKENLQSWDWEQELG